MSKEEIQHLLAEPTNHTYLELSLIGSSCQHIHQPVFSDEEYLLILHLITVFSSCLNFLGLYAIIKKSNHTMGGFKWCLANLQFWIIFTDLCVSILIVPRFYFPLIAGHTLGVFYKIGIDVPHLIYFGFGCFGCMVASVAVLFLYRHQAVVHISSFFRFPKKILIFFVAFNYLLYMNAPLPAIITAPVEQLKTKIAILKEEKCPPKNILDPALYIVQTNIGLLPYLCFLIVLVGTECGLMALHSSWCLFFSTLFQNLSRKTRKMQIKFLFALFAQIAIPTALCYAPIFYCTITTLVDHYNQFANDICVFVFVTHGMISSICLLLFYDCYRDFIFYYICKQRIFSSFSAPFSRRMTLIRSEPISLNVNVTMVV